MTTITFDTLKFVQTLRQSGVEEKQAEAIAVAVGETHASSELATKRDIELVKRDIELVKIDVGIAKLELKKDIAETKAELIRWVVAAGFLQTALISALLMRLVR